MLAERKAQLATLVSREAGKILVEAGGDVQEAIDMAGYIAGQGRNAWGETHPCEMPDKIGFTTRHPVGVVGMITPWNFPVAIPSWKIFPALLAGNGVVIKPSEHAPQCCAEFVRACRDAGVPEGLVKVVNGFGEVGRRDLGARRPPRRSASPARYRPAAWSRRPRWRRARGSCRSSSAARTRWS